MLSTPRISRAANGAAAVAALCLAGCSLMGYGEFDTQALQDNGGCVEVNAYYDLDPARDCRIYQRVEGGVGCALALADWDEDGVVSSNCAGELPEGEPLDCDDDDDRRFPGNDEVCDGVDNNCNQVVDEGALVATDPRLVMSRAAGELSFTHGRDGMIGVVGSEGGEASRNLIDPTGDAQEATAVDYASSIAQDDPNIADMGDINCYQRASGAVSPLAQCNFITTATDRLDDGRWLLASVSNTGCSEGQVRIGYAEAEGDQVILRGPEQHSNIYRGIDTDGDRQCTGSSRDQGAPVGAAAPALAAMSPDRGQGVPQALVGYIADGVQRDVCGGDEANIEVLGVWLETVQTRLSQPLSWTNATGNGIPQSIGESLPAADAALGVTRGGGRPALAAVFKEEGVNKQEGYLLAHGNGAGEVSLHFIPNFDDPPAYLLDDLSPTTEVRTTAALSLDPASGMAIVSLGGGSDRDADHVALALGAYDLDADAQRVGVLWQHGCGDDAVELWFAAVTYHEGGPGRFTQAAPVRLNADGGSAVQPGAAIAYAPAGFITADFEREDSDPAGDVTGGFLVAWIEGTGSSARIAVRRVLDFDDALLDVGAEEMPLPLDLAHPGRVAMITQDHGIALLHLDSAERALYATPLMCAGSEP